jgi:hypothetical protein
MLHNVTDMWHFKKLNSKKQRVEWWLPGAGRRGKWVVFQWVSSFGYARWISVMQDKYILEICQTTWYL